MNAFVTGAAENKGARTISLLMAFVLCLSAYLQLTVASRSESSNPLTADAGRYFSYAYNLQHFGVYSGQVTWDPSHAEGPLAPDKVRSPGYPLFLAALGTVEPSMEWARRIYLWQALLGVLAVGFTFLLAREVLPPAWAAAASAITAISPHLAAITAEILSEAVFTPLLMAAIWMLMRGFKRSGSGWALGSGALFGAASLVRPTVLLLPLFIFVATLLLSGIRPRLRVAGMVLIASCLVQSPWWLRNAVTDLRADPTDLSVNFLHHGSYPDFMYEGRPESLGLPYRFDPAARVDGGSARHAVSAIGRHFRQEPAKYTYWYLIGKPISFLSWDMVGGWADIYTVRPTHSPYLENRAFSAIRGFMHALHAPLMVLGVAGLFLVAFLPQWLSDVEAKLRALKILGAVTVYAFAFHMMGAPFPRYGIPFRPLIYVLAMLPALALWRRGRPRGAGRTP